MNTTQADQILLRSLVALTRGFRVGRSAVLAERAARREQLLLEELSKLEGQDATESNAVADEDDLPFAAGFSIQPKNQPKTGTEEDNAR